MVLVSCMTYISCLIIFGCGDNARCRKHRIPETVVVSVLKHYMGSRFNISSENQYVVLVGEHGIKLATPEWNVPHATTDQTKISLTSTYTVLPETRLIWDHSNPFHFYKKRTVLLGLPNQYYPCRLYISLFSPLFNLQVNRL